MSMIGGAAIGDKVTIRNRDGGMVTGILKSYNDLGVDLSIYAYRNPRHPRFFPWTNIQHLEKYADINYQGENVLPLKK